MPRAGLSIEQQGTSSQFRFEEGNGEIIAAEVAVEQIEGYEPKCGLRVTLRRYTHDWKPSDDDPITEFLGCGPVNKFHPGNAASSDDDDPEDLGADVDTVGNCIFAVEGGKIDRKSKAAVFSTSLQELGFKPALLNGFAPNLIGLKAFFTQHMMPKGPDFQGKRDPTCLIAKDKIFQFPYQTGGKTAAKTGTAKTAVAPAAAAGKKGTAPAAAAATDPAEEAENIAIQLLATMTETNAGQDLTAQKIGSKMLALLAKNRVSPKLHKPVQELIKNAEWLQSQAETMGWGYDDGTVSIPAAE